MISVVQMAANIDWLTVTTKDTDTAREWYLLYLEYANSDHGQQMRWSDNSWYGYSGPMCETLFFGIGNQGTILQLKGAIADVYARRAFGNQANATRVDLAVTARVDKRTLDLGKLYYDKIASLGNGQRTYTLYNNTLGGQTLYVGSRSSSQMGRVYDKGAKLGTEPGWLWRYEVELKKPRASWALSHLYEAIETQGLSDGVHKSLMGYVHGWFSKRGIRPIFDPEPDASVGWAQLEFTQTSVDRKIAWLRSQVRPTIAFLEERGMLGDAVSALGLEAYQLDFSGQSLPVGESEL